jgi:hypothetical protein
MYFFSKQIYSWLYTGKKYWDVEGRMGLFLLWFILRIRQDLRLHNVEGRTWLIMNWEGYGRKRSWPYPGTIQPFSCTDREIARKISVRSVDVRLRREHNTSRIRVCESYCCTNLPGDGDYSPSTMQITFNMVLFLVDRNILNGYRAWGIHVWIVSPTIIHSCPP